MQMKTPCLFEKHKYAVLRAEGVEHLGNLNLQTSTENFDMALIILRPEKRKDLNTPDDHSISRE